MTFANSTQVRSFASIHVHHCTDKRKVCFALGFLFWNDSFGEDGIPLSVCNCKVK